MQSFNFAAAATNLGTSTGLAQGERIYSVRYNGPMGYVVTFRQVLLNCGGLARAMELGMWGSLNKPTWLGSDIFTEAEMISQSSFKIHCKVLNAGAFMVGREALASIKLLRIRQVDPLFAIDLSDPTAPRVLGV